MLVLCAVSLSAMLLLAVLLIKLFMGKLKIYFHEAIQVNFFHLKWWTNSEDFEAWVPVKNQEFLKCFEMRLFQIGVCF